MQLKMLSLFRRETPVVQIGSAVVPSSPSLLADLKEERVSFFTGSEGQSCEAVCKVRLFASEDAAFGVQMYTICILPRLCAIRIWLLSQATT